MNLLLLQVFERRLEILMADFLMHLALYVFTLAVMGIYIVAVIYDKTEIYELVPVLIFSLVVFVVMRGDFMIHRPASYVSYVERELPDQEVVKGKSGEPIMGWEAFKSKRQYTWLVGATDAVGSLVLLFLLYKTQVRLWDKGDNVFVVFTTILILAGAGFIPKVVSLAGR